MVDAAVEASMLDESRQAEEARQLAHAQQVSAAAVPVINEEDDELQRALALSMQPDNHAVSHSTSVPTASAAVAAADEESLAVALRESEQGFLQTLPLPVRRLHIEFKCVQNFAVYVLVALSFHSCRFASEFHLPTHKKHTLSAIVTVPFLTMSSWSNECCRI
jgi:ribosomal protein S1